ncbi:hypothetical protein HYH02_008363 [Chlamydomonas schloesseri]|uniref:Uncharacterized protein n=1 Tax=Chlamydomonas schloesseri TaxID=2026947 RepID=A0A835WG15_9CHLO|nr:hypothetical protein HYH02_008363 [Chlamydomonas schloesseri]|eukprot:KAG2446803.1 hypothetical protein HYH02_008363 [Chlamydomonas schloesseri]
MALVPWIWNLGLSGAEIWIYHRLEESDPRLVAAAATLKSFEPYPCGSTVRLQQLLPNKGREAAVYLSHVVRHYDSLPQGLVLVHDHGPAARHSLCGPFFRRLRGYYAGIREQLAAGLGGSSGSSNSTLAVAGGARRRLEASRRKGSGSSKSSSAAKKALLAEFANQAISLSSGCQENWLKGCCALLVCVEDGDAQPAGSVSGEYELEESSMGEGHHHHHHHRSLTEQWRTPRYSKLNRCPFKSSKCLANASAMSIPAGRTVGGVSSKAGGGGGGGASRWIYMHGGGGLYDTRYENLVVLYGESAEEAAAAATGGHSNLGFGPLSLVRYASQGAVETVRSQTSSSRSLDYPPGAASRSQQETYAALGQIFEAHDFASKRAPGSFKSCCASLMLRPHHVAAWPVSMYEQMLAYTLDNRNTYHASLAVSHHGWAMWAGRETGPADLLRYFEVDLALLHIRGCPGWRMVPA